MKNKPTDSSKLLERNTLSGNIIVTVFFIVFYLSKKEKISNWQTFWMFALLVPYWGRNKILDLMGYRKHEIDSEKP